MAEEHSQHSFISELCNCHCTECWFETLLNHLQILKPITQIIALNGSFPFVPPVCFAPPVAEHVALHSTLLCTNMARASGGANNMHPLSWGAQTEMIPQTFIRLSKQTEKKNRFPCNFFPYFRYYFKKSEALKK